MKSVKTNKLGVVIDQCYNDVKNAQNANRASGKYLVSFSKSRL